MTRVAATSPTTPRTASVRAGPTSSSGVVTSASPLAARLAELTKTKGRSRCIAFHVGVAVSPSSAAVYTASSGPIAPPTSPAGASTTWSTERNGPSGSLSRRSRSTSAAAATPIPPEKPDSIHDPTLIGDVTLKVRSML